MKSFDHAARFGLYTKVCEWARMRYAVNGALIVDVGHVPSIYGRIEAAAFNRYLAQHTI